MDPNDAFQRAHRRMRVLAAPRKSLLQLFMQGPFARLFDVVADGYDAAAPDVVLAGDDVRVTPLFTATPRAALTGGDLEVARHFVECLEERTQLLAKVGRCAAQGTPLESLAGALAMDEADVERCLKGKTVAASQGVVDLASVFRAAPEDESASEMLKTAIREIVAATGERVLSDHEIRIALLERGIDVDSVAGDAVVIRRIDGAARPRDPAPSASADAAIARYRALLGR